MSGGGPACKCFKMQMSRKTAIRMEADDGQSSRRRVYQKAGPDQNDARCRRRQESTLLTKQHREGRLRAKRLKREQEDQGVGYITLLDDLSLNRSLSYVKAKLSAQPEAGRLEAITQLRQLVSAAGDAAAYTEQAVKADRIFEEIVGANLIPKLIMHLLPKQSTGLQQQIALEACWALSNLAAQEYKFSQHVIEAGPVFIAHLSGGFGVAIAEQSAWAIGNLAGECQEFRTALLANGALLPLARLAMHGKSQSEGAAVSAAARTAAWALSNLIKGGGSEVRELLELDGFKSALRGLLNRTDFPGLVTESAWLAAAVLASSHSQLAAGDVLQPLLDILSTAVSQLGQSTSDMEEAGPAPPALAPALRSIGYLAASSSRKEFAEILCSADNQHLRNIIFCSRCAHHGAAKEAAWVLSNLAGLRQPIGDGESVLTLVGGIDVLVQLLRDGTFPIRREAAFGVANLVAVDPFRLPQLVGSCLEEVPGGVLPEFARLAGSADLEAVQLALHFFATVLQELPIGPQMLESVNGIEILEEQQMRGTPEAQEIASQLLKRYFGDDYGL